uniref:Uncharacterized protein n=1 Tax=Arundo donax TaxID=35708 RepID=A0A0A9AJM8_ARUDO
MVAQSGRVVDGADQDRRGDAGATPGGGSEESTAKGEGRNPNRLCCAAIREEVGKFLFLR